MIINKRLKLISGIVICLTLLISFIFSLSFQNRNKSNFVPFFPTPTPINLPVTFLNDQATFKNILPGISKKEQVMKSLGNPTQTSTTGNYEVLYYAAGDTLRQNAVYISNNIAKYIVEEITINNTYYKDFLSSQQIKPDGILYDPKYPGTNYSWYVFAPKGVAFFIEPSSGYTFRIQYFPKMNYSDYLNYVAKDFSLSTTPIENKDHYSY